MRKKMFRVGERTNPCGTPLKIVRVMESERLYLHWADHPLK